MAKIDRTPDRLTLIAFLTIALFLGVNFVAVRFINRELPPLWGAALRFIIASVLLFGIARVKNIPLPKGQALLGAGLFGLLVFGINFGLLSWALVTVSAGIASVVFATIPLLTLLIANLIGLEKITWKGILGAIIVMGGISLVFNEQLNFDVPLMPIIAVFLAAVAAASSGIAVKYFPKSHPVSTNAVATAVGAIVLVLASFIIGETYKLPSLTPTRLALGWLIISSIVAFPLMVWLISKWNASAASYTAVLTPLLTVATASVLAGEAVTITFLGGSLLVLLGVYIGTLSSEPHTS